uniref:Uncharacterized protein n=1 Tax=Anguilla anguilla TaxID=7936 RepID=A0A0E9VX51_ANGAN
MPSLQSIICLRVALDAVHLSLHRFTKLKQSTDLQAPIKTFSSLNILIIVVVPITNRMHVLLILVEVHVQ